jgi:RND family efflux transporter MFP subunit
MNARNRTFAILVSIVAMTISYGCGHDEPHHAAGQLESMAVQTAEVEVVSEAKAIDVRGIVQPNRQAMISSRAMGPVVALKVRAGDTVKKGQALIEIQPAQSEGQLAQAKGALAQAEAALSLAERNYQRFQALHDENASSELELDMARMQYEQASGAVEQARGAVQTASSIANESSVRAPFNARIVSTMAEVGDLAAPGRPLVQLESIGGQQIWLSVRESDIARVQEGEEVNVVIDSRTDLGTLQGRVEEIVPSADPATHSFTVKVGLGDVSVPSGLFGRAAISGDSTDRLVVPLSAVHRRGGLELVVVRSDDGTARTRAVTTGGTLDDGRIEVLSGLRDGDVVAINAPGPVADGTPLEVSQ